jgi:hypothetical protein
MDWREGLPRQISKVFVPFSMLLGLGFNLLSEKGFFLVNHFFKLDKISVKRTAVGSARQTQWRSKPSLHLWKVRELSLLWLLHVSHGSDHKECAAYLLVDKILIVSLDAQKNLCVLQFDALFENRSIHTQNITLR